MPTSHLVVVMPAYNEAEGLPGFIDEIRSHLKPHVEQLSFVVADDRSTDETVKILYGLQDPDLHVEPQSINRGHGPTALAAYRAGLALHPDVVIHVDGDGQFIGEDFPKLLGALAPGIDVVRGVRQNRTDPWFRKVLTACVRGIVSTAAGKWQPDVNTPMRAYRPEMLRMLINAVPEHANVPHVHFSLAEARAKLVAVNVPVESIPRRGSNETGTMWGQIAAPKLPPKRLRQFTRLAAVELWQVSLRPGAPTRKARRPE